MYQVTFWNPKELKNEYRTYKYYDYPQVLKIAQAYAKSRKWLRGSIIKLY